MSRFRRLAAVATSLTATSAIVMTLAACRPGEEPGTHIAGWTMIDPAQRHPIIVSQQPANLAVRVARGSRGLSPHERAHVAEFLTRYRGRDSGASRIVITVPSGAPNETAALHAVADLRELMQDYGLDDSRISVRPYHAGREPQPPIHVSYAKFVAEGPTCGLWPNNVSDDPRNLPYHDFGCSTQKNIAAQIANPADLLGPRTMSPAGSERRDQAWGQWLKGESTTSERKQDERAQTKNTQ